MTRDSPKHHYSIFIKNSYYLLASNIIFGSGSPYEIFVWAKLWVMFLDTKIDCSSDPYATCDDHIPLPSAENESDI